MSSYNTDFKNFVVGEKSNFFEIRIKKNFLNKLKSLPLNADIELLTKIYKFNEKQGFECVFKLADNQTPDIDIVKKTVVFNDFSLFNLMHD